MQPPSSEQNTPKRNLSSFQCTCYGLGSLGSTATNMTIMSWITYFYAPPERVIAQGTPALLPTFNVSFKNKLLKIGPTMVVGFIMLFGRIVDALADPPVGYWSDNTRSRRGRRMPFILYGSPFLILVFILLWFPPSLWTGNTGSGMLRINFIYMALMLGLFFFMYTIVFCPIAALLPDLARTSAERVGLSTYNALFQLVSTVIAAVGTGQIIEYLGFQKMGIILGIVGMISFIPLLIYIKEKSSMDMPSAQEGFNLLTALGTTLKNKPYMIFLFSMAVLQLGFNMILISVPYLVTEVVGKPKGWVSYFMGANVICSLISFVPVTILSRKWGKSRVYSIVLFMLGCMMPFTLLIRPISKFLPIVPLTFFFIGLAGIPLAGFFILPSAIVGDCIDYEARQTGIRREAMYFGVQGIMTKGMVGVASVIFGVLTSVYGNSRGHSLGIELVGPVTAIFIFVGWLIFRYYPLTDDVIRGWQRELPAQSGPVPPEMIK